MLDAILKAGAEAAEVEAPSLMAGEWGGDGARMPRTGPYVRRVVSHAPEASSGDIARAVAFAARGAGVEAAPAPASSTGRPGPPRTAVTPWPGCWRSNWASR